MQLLILGLFLLIYLHDEVQTLTLSGARPWVLWASFVGLKLGLIFVYAGVCRATVRRMALPDGSRHVRRMERVSGHFRIAVLVLYALDLYQGVLTEIRHGIAAWTGLRHPILIDEVLVMLPTLAMWGAGWWLAYPIEKRLREAALMRNLDRGLPVFPVWSRWQFVLSQYRYQVALILLPLLGVIAWTEIVAAMVRAGLGWVPLWSEPAWTVAGCAGIFVVAPLIIRLAWDTVPLPEGDLRAHLMSMCRMHRVKIRELLLWRTYGGMINAAVMGLIGPLRYILITDGLLQQMPMHHVEAVMAHELAHIRKRHMFWLLVAAVGLLSVAEACALLFLAASGVGAEDVEHVLAISGERSHAGLSGYGIGSFGRTHLLLLAALVGAVVVWATGFGWVSRRAERQADSFAVAHLVRERDDDTVQARDAQTMIEALQHVADLNHVRAGKHSWRHGSIRWRQDYLRGLVGQRIDRLPIDRQMRWVNALLLLAVVAAVGLHAWGRLRTRPAPPL